MVDMVKYGKIWHFAISLQPPFQYPYIYLHIYIFINLWGIGFLRGCVDRHKAHIGIVFDPQSLTPVRLGKNVKLPYFRHKYGLSINSA